MEGMMPEVLYNSAKISARIRTLFKEPSSSDRRVVLVAYVGRNYAQFLPDVRGIEIVCSPTAGATSASAVSELKTSGAVVKFSDELHMKVYWSAERGCLITSANLSANALQRGKLKEVGVFLNSKDVEIDELLKEAQPYSVTDAHLRKLKKKEDQIDRAMALAGLRRPQPGFQYLEWYKQTAPTRKEWKLGYWDVDVDFAVAGKELAKSMGRSEPVNCYNVADKQVADGDWLLQFQIDPRKKRVMGSSLQWMFVDGIVPNDRKEDDDLPYQAIQIWPDHKCPHPPFAVTPAFVKAFKAALEQHWSASEEGDTMIPSQLLLDEITRRMGG
jgi:hypothetical protein